MTPFETVADLLLLVLSHLAFSSSGVCSQVSFGYVLVKELFSKMQGDVLYGMNSDGLCEGHLRSRIGRDKPPARRDYRKRGLLTPIFHFFFSQPSL